MISIVQRMNDEGYFHNCTAPHNSQLPSSNSMLFIPQILCGWFQSLHPGKGWENHDWQHLPQLSSLYYQAWSAAIFDSNLDDPFCCMIGSCLIVCILLWYAPELTLHYSSAYPWRCFVFVKLLMLDCTYYICSTTMARSKSHCYVDLSPMSEQFYD